jgi:hypothetical protein
VLCDFFIAVLPEFLARYPPPWQNSGKEKLPALTGIAHPSITFTSQRAGLIVNDLSRSTSPTSILVNVNRDQEKVDDMGS